MADLAFAFAAGRGEVGRQAAALARSVRAHHPDADLYALVPESERDDLDPAVREALADRGEVLTGEVPVPEYPISTKIEAMRRAEAATDADYVAMLDADTVLFEPLSVHESGRDLCLKPVDVGRQFWGRDRSADWWRYLYALRDREVPDWRVTSTFDGVEMLPYWNAGLVVSGVEGFADAWLDLTVDLYGQIPYDRHADQVALGILSADRDVAVLDARQNYPVHLHLRCPADVVTLHYHDRRQLRKVSDASQRERLREWGLDPGGTLWTDPALLGRSLLRYAKRKALPLNEEHRLERLYRRLTGRPVGQDGVDSPPPI